MAGIEFRCIVEETAGGSGTAQQRLGIPAAVCGKVPDRIRPVGHEPPQIFRRVHAARIAAAHSDDGNGLGGYGFQFVYPTPCTSQLGGGALEVVEELFITHQGFSSSSSIMAKRSAAVTSASSRSSSEPSGSDLDRADNIPRSLTAIAVRS